MVFSWSKNPLIYEINTWTWLHALSQQTGEPVTLADVPDAALEELAAWGFDAIWLMGVWERSPRGQQIAREHPDLQAGYRAALPDFTPADVIGSPYAVRRYTVDPRLGERNALVSLRRRLRDLGLGLVLDFVPNHVAVDHPWLAENPSAFILGEDHGAESTDGYFRGPDGHVFAHGRDPYFPAWTDTAQVNAFDPTLRARAASTLLDIAALCDGVRCDMAMLVTNDVFRQTWGDRAGRKPSGEYWDAVIPPVKVAYPDFRFMAEVYWDMEPVLLQQGFDYTYDKRLYDRLVHEGAPSIVAHLGADLTYQQHLIRFIENHDEPRAVTALGPGRDLAAAVLVTTLPGAVLLHEGQLAGHQIRLPVQLDRRPVERKNDAVATFYRMLLAEVTRPVYRNGTWSLGQVVQAWDGNESHQHLIAFTWRMNAERRLVVVNYSGGAAQGRVRIPKIGLAQKAWQLEDVLHPGRVYLRDGNEMAQAGLHIDLPPWGAHLFRFVAAED